MIQLKHFFLASVLALFSFSCNFSSSDKSATDDSLQYYPPTPAMLEKEEFRAHVRQLKAFFDSTLYRTGFSGGILVAKKGAILYEDYTGYADAVKKHTLTDSSSLHIASSGKTITAVATLRLVQEKKLSLDDSLHQLFPGFPYPGITVQMLLNHRSGIPNYLYFISNSKWDKKRSVTNSDVLDLLISLKPARSFSPNTGFSYSNTNYVLLALIIEKITGKSFPEYLQQKFFVPLQMRHSFVYTPADSFRANPSFTGNGAYWQPDFLDLTYGDKNIYSTPRDLLKWDQALYTNQVLDSKMLEAAFTPYSFEKPSTHNYGLGFRLLLLPNGKKVIYHFGKWHGNNAVFARLTEEKVTIIILGNKLNRQIYSVAGKAYRLFGNYATQPGMEYEQGNTLENGKQPTP